MEAPQIIFIVLLSIGLLIAAHDHGKERQPTNFWYSLLGAAITVGLLWWGGFFK